MNDYLKEMRLANGLTTDPRPPQEEKQVEELADYLTGVKQQYENHQTPKVHSEEQSVPLNLKRIWLHWTCAIFAMNLVYGLMVGTKLVGYSLGIHAMLNVAWWIVLFTGALLLCGWAIKKIVSLFGGKK